MYQDVLMKKHPCAQTCSGDLPYHAGGISFLPIFFALAQLV